MMSATPIPRTLAMSYFADMDISIINEIAPGDKVLLQSFFNEERRSNFRYN